MNAASRARSAEFIVPKLEVGNRKKRATSMLETTTKTTATTGSQQQQLQQQQQQQQQQQNPRHKSLGNLDPSRSRRERMTPSLRGKCSQSPIIQVSQRWLNRSIHTYPNCTVTILG